MKTRPVIDKKMLLVFLAVSVLLNNGCAKKERSEKESVEHISLCLLTGPTWVPLFHEMLDDFMKDHPEIKVRLEVEGGDAKGYYSKLMTRIAGGTAPDVAYIHPSRIIPFACKNAVLDLTPFLEKDRDVKLDNYYPISVEPYRYHGKLYGLPADLGTHVIFYNKNLFDAAKLPYPTENWTWNDYLKIAKALTKDFNEDGRTDQFGVSVSKYDVFDMVWQAGGEIVDDYENPKKCLLDSNEAIEGLQFCVDLVQKYHVAPKQWEIKDMGAMEMFMTGRIAMYWSANHIIPALRKINDFEWDVVCLPKGKRKASGMGGICVAISAQSKHQQASWELVKYIGGPKAQAILVKTGWPIPSLKDENLIEMFLSSTPPDNRQVFLDTLGYAHSAPRAPNWLEVNDAIQLEIEAALIGEKSPSEALSAATAKVNKLLAVK